MSLPQCYEKCGTGWTPYGKWGVIAGILAWVIPLFALIGNMHFSHFDVRILDKSEGESLLDMTIRHLINGGRSLLFNYVSIILHVLGDITPPQSMHQEDLKHLEVICFALDDFDPKYRVTSKGIPGGFFARKLVNFIQDDRLTREDREDILIPCNHASTVLSQTRIKSARRSMLTIIAYAYPMFTLMASGKASTSTPVHFPRNSSPRVALLALVRNYSELCCWSIPNTLDLTKETYR